MKLNTKSILKILLTVLLSGLIIALIVDSFLDAKYSFGFTEKLLTALNFLNPFFIGLSMAFVLNVFLTGFETKIFGFMTNSKYGLVRKLQRPLCLALTYILAFGLLAVLVLVIIPDISKTVTFLINNIPKFITDSRNWLIKTLEDFKIPADSIPQINVESLMSTLNSYFSDSGKSSNLVNNAVKITGNVLSALSDILFGVILSVYVLAQKEKIGAFMKRVINSFLPEKTANIVHHVCAQTYFSFARFIGGQLTEAVILGTLCYIGMLIFRFPNALIVSIIICVTALVPVVGAFTGAVIGGFLILITDPIKAVLFVVFLIVLQQLEGNLIYPRVVGKAVGLPGVIVISAVLIGGNIGGILGSLVSVPLTAVFYTLLKEAMDIIATKKSKEKEQNVTQE